MPQVRTEAKQGHNWEGEGEGGLSGRDGTLRDLRRIWVRPVVTLPSGDTAMVTRAGLGAKGGGCWVGKPVPRSVHEHEEAITVGEAAKGQGG